MASPVGKFTVRPGTASLVVAITGNDPTCWTAQSGTVTHTMPKTITTNTDFWTVAGRYTVTITLNGVTIESRSIEIQPGTGLTIDPDLDSFSEKASELAAAATAAAALVDDTAYDASSWNGVTTIAPSKNAVRDKFESLSSGAVSDTAYDATSWNGVTDVAPSKNAVRDKIESLSGASSQWDEHDLDVLEASWTDDGVGTWTFAAGVISQTDNTADSFLQYNTPIPSTQFVIQVDVRIPTGQDSLTVSQAIMVAGNPDEVIQSVTGVASVVGEGVCVLADAAGDTANLGVVVTIDGNIKGNGGWAAGITHGTWHTVRAVVNGVRQTIYVDGVYVMSCEAVTGGNIDDVSVPVKPDLPMLGTVGKADFRLPKVWTPALPA